MIQPFYRVAAFSMLLAGCAAVPGYNLMPDNPAPASAPAAAHSARTLVEALEHQHRERAQAYDGERNWADALVQWDLLTLLKPDAPEYREAAAATRMRIRTAAAGLLRAAEFARKQGNLELAIQLYLRVLNLDRADAAAAQALREMDVERTQRTYFNRPPRGSY